MVQRIGGVGSAGFAKCKTKCHLWLTPQLNLVKWDQLVFLDEALEIVRLIITK